MKTLRTVVTLLWLVVGSLPAYAQKVSLAEVSKKIGLFITKDCSSLTGDAKNPEVKELDIQKNRSTIPQAADFDKNVTLRAMLAAGEDRTRFHLGKAAEIVGYIEDIHAGGVETCNCHTKDDILRDTHINVVLTPMKSSLPVIVEVTCRFRKMMAEKGIDWTTRALRDRFKGRWVKIQGWLFYDKEHESQADNTAPGKPHNWRKTAWELHPVTSMEVTERPSDTFANPAASQPTTQTQGSEKSEKSVSSAGNDKVVGKYKGRTLFLGPRGGKYYLNDSGEKVYINKK